MNRSCKLEKLLEKYKKYKAIWTKTEDLKNTELSASPETYMLLPGRL